MALSKNVKREVLESIQACKGNQELLAAYREVYEKHYSKRTLAFFDANSDSNDDELKRQIASLDEFNFEHDSYERCYERDYFADIERGRREVLASL